MSSRSLCPAWSIIMPGEPTGEPRFAVVPAEKPQPPAASDSRALLTQAEHLIREGHIREAEALFRHVIDSESNNAAGHYGIGFVRLALGDPHAAAECFRRALELDPNHANAAFQLGAIAHRGGNTDEAVAYYERAVSIDPSHVSATLTLERPGHRAGATSHRLPADAVGDRFGVYDYLRQDRSPLSRQTVELIDGLNWSCRPRFLAYIGRHPLAYGVLALMVPIGLWALLVGLIRVKSTRVTLARGRLQIEKGVFTKRLINVELWRVQTIELHRSFINRLTGDGTLLFTIHIDPTTQKPGQHPNPIRVTGIASGAELKQRYHQLLNLVFLLRSNPAVKGIIQ